MDYYAGVCVDCGQLHEIRSWTNRTIQVYRTGTTLETVIEYAKNGQDTDYYFICPSCHHNIDFDYIHLIKSPKTNQDALQFLRMIDRNGEMKYGRIT